MKITLVKLYCAFFLLSTSCAEKKTAPLQTKELQQDSTAGFSCPREDEILKFVKTLPPNFHPNTSTLDDVPKRIFDTHLGMFQLKEIANSRNKTAALLNIDRQIIFRRSYSDSTICAYDIRYDDDDENKGSYPLRLRFSQYHES